MVSTWSQGIRNVITTTGGEGNWRNDWNFDIQGKTIFIVYDIDEEGIEGAKRLYQKIKDICQAYIVSLPPMPLFPNGKQRKDLTDFWGLGNDAAAFLKCVPKTHNYHLNSFNDGPAVILRTPLPVLFTDNDQNYLDELENKETIVDDYVAFARTHVNSPVSFHRLSCLWLLSNLLGRNCVSTLGNSPVFPNLWTILVGPSTVVQKSSTTYFARGLLNEVIPDQDPIAATSFTPEGFMRVLAERDEDYITSAIYYDEIAALFDAIKSKDFMSTMRDTLINIHDNEKMVYEKSKESTRVENSYVTLIGNTTAVRLAELLSWRDIESGFLIRFLIALETSGEPFKDRDYESTRDDRQRREFIKRFKRIYKRWKKTWAIPLEDETQWLKPKNKRQRSYQFRMPPLVLKRYNEFSKACIYSEESQKHNHVGLVHARLPMLCQKLATIYAACDPSTRVFWNMASIRMEHLLMAIRDLSNYRRHMVDLVLQVGSSENEHFITEIYALIFKKKRITRTEIAAHIKTDKKILDSVLDTMIDRGMLIQLRHSDTLIEYMLANY